MDYNYRELLMVRMQYLIYTEWAYEGNPKRLIE